MGQLLEEGKVVIYLLCFLLLIVCLLQVHWHGLNLRAWDLLLLSGVATFTLGVYLWLDIPQNLKTMLDRLRHRGALDISKEKCGEKLVLNDEQDAQSRELLKNKPASKTKQYWDIENLSTWPVSVQTRRLFRRNNVALLLPSCLSC